MSWADENDDEIPGMDSRPLSPAAHADQPRSHRTILDDVDL